MIKRFKFVSDEQLTILAKRYEKGGTSKLIYVHQFDDGSAETLEVFIADSHLDYFNTLDDMYEYFAESKPLVKDILDGRQATLF
ncbi:hypothetical protein MUA52_05115 [Staphylococcus agnetis]|uniref:hypothetical protein n=1 Tax=Staphylococcus agnetis TaxID=985762 RepID=UPI0021D348C5|nr:hypothetical protein [Staphylococcus agnetis]UXU66007.1 hypothetical protein MUA52_09245 [Staphylococcus agnetis]UXU67466.1 hypothetical protein MUA52_05115 [Staphylococcus agnetis]